MLTSVKYQALARDGFLFHNKDGMKRVLLILGLIFLLLGIPITVFIVGQRQELRQKAAPATTLSFSPSAASHLVGETFPLEVTLNSGENQVVAIELHITYDPTKLEAQTITNGPLFPNVLASGVVAPGTASITVGAPDAKSPVKGSGTAAVVRLVAKQKTDAPVSVQFSKDTFVGGIGEGATNVLIGTTPATITIGETAASPEPTPLPTSSGQVTPAPTPPPGSTPTPTIVNGSQEITPDALKILTPAGEAASENPPKIEGKAPPGSSVTITVYSTPITVVITADANGNWVYTPEGQLDPGPHNVVVSASTSEGTQTATTSFVIAAAAGIGGQSSQSAIPASGTVSTTYILVFLALSFVTTGFLLPMISSRRTRL